MVWLRVSDEVAIKLLAKATVSEFLSRAGGPTSKCTYMTMAGGFLSMLVLHRVAYNMIFQSQEISDSEREKKINMKQCP